MDTIRLKRFVSEKSLFNLTATIMILMPFAEIITDIFAKYRKDIVPSMFQPVILSLFGVLGTIIVLLCKIDEKKWYFVDVCYLALVLFMVLSAIFSVNPGVYSNNDVLVGETPYHFLAYFSLFFFGTRISSDKYRIKIVIIFILIAAVQSVFAFFQTFNIEVAYCLLLRHDRAAYGLTQNSNYYGGLSVFFIALTSGCFLFVERLFKLKIWRFILPALSGLLFYTMMGSRARLAWLGFAAMILFYLVSGLVMLKGNIEKQVMKRFFIRFAVLMVVFAAFFAITHITTNFVNEEIQRTQWEIEGKLNNGLGSDRLLNWKYGLESFRKHWITGIGLDNYIQVFFENPKYVEGTYFQAKAHNEYLHIMCTQGIFAIVAYLFILFRTLVIAVRGVFRGGDETSQVLTWVFLSMFVAYAAQAFLNSSVINVAMYFWIVLGILNPCGSPLRFSLKK